MSLDYVKRAKSRVISQYTGDSKLILFLSLYAQLIENEFENFYDKLSLIYSIDDNEGAQLDLIGRVLVQPRPLVANADLSFFGYLGTPGATGYNEAPYYDPESEDEIIVPLPDPAYKKLLKAKAARNTTACTIDQIILIARAVTGDQDITLTNNQDMTFNLVFSEDLTAYDQLLIDNLDVIPAPAGVEFAGWSVV